MGCIPIDRKTRKLFTIYGALHPKSDYLFILFIIYSLFIVDSFTIEHIHT